MRFLVDEGVSPLVAERLQQLGHGAVHVHTAGLSGRDDGEVMSHAARNGMALSRRQEQGVVVSVTTRGLRVRELPIRRLPDV